MLTLTFMALAYVIAPAFQRTGSRANLVEINNAKNIVLALHNYTSMSQGSLPQSSAGEPPRSWRVDVVQFLDRADLHRSYQTDVAWDQEPNAALTRTRVKVWHNPRSTGGKPDGAGRYLADFGMITGPGTVAPPGETVALEQISQGDGLGQTLMIGECSGLRIVWTEPRDPDVSREQIGIEVLSRAGQTSNQLLSGYFTDGAVAGYADGAARFVSKNIDRKVLKALTTIDGGEPINQSDYLK